MQDKCCGMDKENCCMGEGKQTYTVWERQCDQDTELECPVTVQRQCYPIRVPECRTITDIRRKTFQVKSFAFTAQLEKTEVASQILISHLSRLFLMRPHFFFIAFLQGKK